MVIKTFEGLVADQRRTVSQLVQLLGVKFENLISRVAVGEKYLRRALDARFTLTNKIDFGLPSLPYLRENVVFEADSLAGLKVKGFDSNRFGRLSSLGTLLRGFLLQFLFGLFFLLFFWLLLKLFLFRFFPTCVSLFRFFALGLFTASGALLLRSSFGAFFANFTDRSFLFSAFLLLADFFAFFLKSTRHAVFPWSRILDVHHNTSANKRRSTRGRNFGLNPTAQYA